MRPAEVCGWVRRPRRSSSASSLRTGGVETPRPLRSRGVREPTGWRVATYSSTTRRRIVPWRSLSSTAFMAFAGTLRQQLGGHAAAEVAAALRQRELVVAALDEAEPLQPLERLRIDRAMEAGEGERLVQAEAEQDALGALYRRVQRLDLPRRSLARRKGGEIDAESRGRPPPAAPAPRAPAD